MISRIYRVGASTVTIVLGDLLHSRAEVLVSSDDYRLSMGGGVSAAIRFGAGDQLDAEARKMAPAKLGDVIVTTAGRLRSRYVLHAVTVGPDYRDMPADAIVRLAVSKALKLTPLLGCRSVAFPVIGTGMAGIDFDVAAAQMAGTIAGTLLRSEEPLNTEIYVMPRGTLSGSEIFSAFERHMAGTLGLETHGERDKYTLEAPVEKLDAAPGSADGDRKSQVHRMLKHLDARRDQLEAALIGLLGGDRSTKSISELRAQLEELKVLRAGYELELAGRSDRRPASENSVFLSSTSTDLKPHRESLRAVIERLGLRFIGMEDFKPSESAPADLIRRRVEEAKIYLGVIGMRYGHIEPSTGLSMTELEYRQAIASNKPMRIFVMDNNASITPSMVESDAEAFAKLLAFRAHLMKAHTCAYFVGPGDLGEKAAKALQPED